ncbi:hypothetical protein ABT369_39325 [Dactylosporangium sp. NPDC000244]|uniref:hypothetical protein n=1 Tax=Dactylosporangium sp. NPDC000244 TaxID=3154365 RepID=UPI00332E637D
MTAASTITSNSRDGQWTYRYDSICGYLVTVIHRPTGRTVQVRGGVTAARRMARSGALHALVEAVAG